MGYFFTLCLDYDCTKCMSDQGFYCRVILFDLIIIISVILCFILLFKYIIDIIIYYIIIYGKEYYIYKKYVIYEYLKDKEINCDLFQIYISQFHSSVISILF